MSRNEMLQSANLLKDLGIKKDFVYQEAVVNYFSRQLPIIGEMELKFQKSENHRVYFIAEFYTENRGHRALVSVVKNSLEVHMYRSKSWSSPVAEAV